jgi:hypothetical protein
LPWLLSFYTFSCRLPCCCSLKLAQQNHNAARGAPLRRDRGKPQILEARKPRGQSADRRPLARRGAARRGLTASHRAVAHHCKVRCIIGLE